MRCSILPSVLILGAALLWGSVAAADPKKEAANTFAFQLELAKAKRANEKKVVVQVARGDCFESVAEAKAVANRERKHLVILVGMTCTDLPDYRAKLSECVWCHQDTFNGSTAPRLLVPTDHGSWSFPKAKLDAKEYSPADVRAVLGRRVSSAKSVVSAADDCQECATGR